MTQDNERHSVFFCRKGKASQGDKIELFRMPPRLQQHGAECRAAQSIFCRFQSVFCNTRGYEQKTGGIKTKIFKPRPIGLTAFMAGHLFADPDPVPPLGEPPDETKREPRRSGQIGGALRAHFVQVIARESAAWGKVIREQKISNQ